MWMWKEGDYSCVAVWYIPIFTYRLVIWPNTGKIYICVCSFSFTTHINSSFLARHHFSSLGVPTSCRFLVILGSAVPVRSGHMTIVYRSYRGPISQLKQGCITMEVTATAQVRRRRPLHTEWCPPMMFVGFCSPMNTSYYIIINKGLENL
jgi:hypothetical protein